MTRRAIKTRSTLWLIGNYRKAIGLRRKGYLQRILESRGYSFGKERDYYGNRPIYKYRRPR